MGAHMDVSHLQIPTNDIQLHLAVLGEGPLVVFCHGFPGLWYSFRHQLEPVASAGFRAVAIDQRGFGYSSRPKSVEAYDSEQHCQAMSGEHTSEGILEFSWSTLPETDDHKRFQREAWISIVDINYCHI